MHRKNRRITTFVPDNRVVMKEGRGKRETKVPGTFVSLFNTIVP